MAKGKDELLEDLRRRKRNRHLSEVEAVLKAFGWMQREAAKEGSVWTKGAQTLTLPMPHGKGDKSLKLPYVSLVVRLIDWAETLGTKRSEKTDEEND